MSDEEIIDLLERHTAAKRTLDVLEMSLRDARRAYASNNGLLAFPTFEAMRRGLGLSSRMTA